jgi:hypothetical protein
MRATSSIISAAVAALLLGCSDSTGPSEPPGALRPQPPGGQSFRVSPNSATLQSGQTLQLATTYAGNPALSGGQASLSWQSSDPSVATVSSTGIVRGIGSGQARIFAILGGYQASAVVTVVGPMKKHEGPIVCLSRTPHEGHQPRQSC